ncbi:MAG TPA: LamG-like jellyroll fold domain-containing protein, partial [Paludibacter sp.]|nr:LamG-like jellyroll fold domain-containing protein [Paludibacter sp.]
DIYSYDNCRYRKGAEYVARYNIGDSVGGVWKYNDLPYTTYSRLMGSTCTWYTETALGGATRGKLGASWELIYNHYARRLNQGDKVKSVYEILQQQQGWSKSWPTLNIHADTYDTPGGGGLTFATDSGSYILPWLNMDISARSITKLPYYGKTTLKDSTLTVIGSGSGIKGISDQFQYAYQKLVDDGSIETQIASLDEVNALCQAGLMIRENLEQNSANVFLSLSAAQGVLLTSRDSTGLTAANIASNASLNTFPYWLRLSRSGNTFIASVSPDRANWTEVGSKTIKMNRLVYAGLAVSSKNGNVICTAVFNKTKMKQGNMRPVLKVTSPVLGTTPYVTPANVKIAGTAYDMDGLLDKAEVYVNGNLVYTTKVSPFTYNLSNQAEGSYSVYVKAYDRQGATSTSDTVKYTVNPLTTKLPWYKFDETKTGYFAYDSSGNSMTAYVYGSAVPLAAGKYNYCLKFDGVNDYVKIPNGSVEKLGDFTISAWVNMDSIATWSRIFDFGSGTSANMYLTATNGNGKIQFSLTPANGTSQSVEASTTLPLKTWCFVTVTLGANKACIYLNGVLVGSGLSFTNRPYDLGATTANYIGKSQYASDPYFKGSVDDFRFFNYAMTAEQIKTIMNPTAINDVKANPQLFYPNPAKGEIRFANAENSELRIYDSMGRLTLQQQINTANQPVDISRLTQGVYIVKTTDKQFNQQQNRLIVK